MNTEKLRELLEDMRAFGGANAAYIDRLAAIIAEEEAREPVGYVFRDSSGDTPYLVGAINHQDIEVGTPLFAGKPPSAGGEK